MGKVLLKSFYWDSSYSKDVEKNLISKGYDVVVISQDVEVEEKKVDFEILDMMSYISEALSENEALTWNEAENNWYRYSKGHSFVLREKNKRGQLETYSIDYLNNTRRENIKVEEKYKFGERYVKIEDRGMIIEYKVENEEHSKPMTVEYMTITTTECSKIKKIITDINLIEKGTKKHEITLMMEEIEESKRKLNETFDKLERIVNG